MAKLLHTSASIAVTLISASLIVVVAASFLPLFLESENFGLGITWNEELGYSLDEDSMTLILVGSCNIVSSYPYDVTDINASVRIDDGSGGGLEIFKKGPMAVIGNGESTLDIYSEIFIPPVLIAALAANIDSEEEGLCLPLTLEVGGSYLERLITLKVSAKVNIVLSGIEIPAFTTDITDKDGNATDSIGEVAKVVVGVDDIPGEEFIEDLPDSAVITIPAGDGGEEIIITFTKAGPDGDGNYSISIGIESSNGTLMDALDYLRDKGEAVEINVEGNMIELDPENVALLADSLEAALEALMP